MNKQTLVILPGWGGTKETWKEFCDLAREDFEIVCLELPCFGLEPCPEAVWGVEDYADFVEKRITELSIYEPVNLLGHSFGGQVAAYLTANNPELISSLILSGPAIYRPKKGFKRAVFNIVSKVGKTLFKIPGLSSLEDPARNFLYKIAKSPDYVKTTGIKRDIFKKIIRQNFSDLLKDIKVMTLVIWGDKDNYVPLRHGKKIVKIQKFQKLTGKLSKKK